MNKQQIVYERDINTSYMKVSACLEENLDVRIMFHRKIKGMISVERCYINGEGQYWYDISGKQALDSYVKMNALEYSFFEILILRICEQLEILEWNLLDSNGLIIDPQYIFLNNKGEDISFVFYPRMDGDILKDIQKLLEYLLTKLNHSDQICVEGAYELYEMSLQEDYQVQDLKNAILRRRMKEKREQKGEKKEMYETEREGILEYSRVSESECTYGGEKNLLENKENFLQNKIEEKLAGLYKKVKEVLSRKHKEDIPTVVYPEEREEEHSVEIHPTVCITATLTEPRGILIYEGREDYPDFEIDKMICVVGKSPRARMQIDRETVSNYHAKIDYMDGYYIEDMNSTNGTFVNDEIINYKERRLLNAGDVIRFADVKYRFL